MPARFHHHARMDAFGEQEARTRMAQVVKPDPPQSGFGNDAVKVFVKLAKFKRRALACGEQRPAVNPLGSGQKPSFELAAAMSLERRDEAIVQL